jgi:hypothetical protein
LNLVEWSRTWWIHIYNAMLWRFWDSVHCPKLLLCQKCCRHNLNSKQWTLSEEHPYVMTPDRGQKSLKLYMEYLLNWLNPSFICSLQPLQKNVCKIISDIQGDFTTSLPYLWRWFSGSSQVKSTVATLSCFQPLRSFGSLKSFKRMPTFKTVDGSTDDS